MANGSKFGTQKFVELKSWDSSYSEDEWTASLIGLTWSKDSGVQETWLWAPPDVKIKHNGDPKAKVTKTSSFLSFSEFERVHF